MAITQRLLVTPTNFGKFVLFDTKRGKCIDLPVWDTRADAEALQALTADPRVIERRAKLAANRPELAASVDAAVAARLAEFDADLNDGEYSEAAE